MEVSNDLKDSRYLGLPSLVGRAKKSVFNFIKEKVWRKFQYWNNKLPSEAGKSVMIQNVAQSIPSYCMSCFLLLVTLCAEIERIMNSYWWGSGENNSKGIKWLAWKKLAISKEKRGLGFRNLHGFNLALLGKHIWKLCNNPDSLLSRLFKARYFPNSHVLQATKGSDSSLFWKGILEAKEQLQGGFRWIIGDGNEIKLFRDPWI